VDQLVEHLSLAELEAGLDQIREAPADLGTLEMIVRRPAVDAREQLDEGYLSLDEGLAGDTWRRRGNRHTPDGSADPQAQITVMSIRAAGLVAVDPVRRELAGDQLYVDLDISVANLPPGTRLAIGDAVLEISEKPHTGCAKFQARFGNDAMRFVNSPRGRELRLRGLNARVFVPGAIHRGDTVRKLPR